MLLWAMYLVTTEIFSDTLSVILCLCAKGVITNLIKLPFLYAEEWSDISNFVF